MLGASAGPLPRVAPDYSRALFAAGLVPSVSSTHALRSGDSIRALCPQKIQKFAWVFVSLSQGTVLCIWLETQAQMNGGPMDAGQKVTTYGAVSTSPHLPYIAHAKVHDYLYRNIQNI